MTADFPVLLDACVLANFGVCDLFLRLAETPRLYVPRWSEEILDEVRRTQLTKFKPPWPERLAVSWRQAVTQAFPDAGVADYASFLPLLANEEKDRHVLAAAIKGGVSVIVTFNLRHFPSGALKPWRIEAVHPQDYLLTLYSMHPGVVATKLAAISQRNGAELEDTLIRLGKSVPRFATQVLSEMGESGGPLGFSNQTPE